MFAPAAYIVKAPVVPSSHPGKPSCCFCRTEAKEELRRQVGNFRMDLNTIASSKGSKAERKEVAAKAKSLIGACEELDYAIQTKNLDKAQKLYSKVKSELSSFTSTALA
jgi:photosystem II oxygen-evolving enhancer protein 3